MWALAATGHAGEWAVARVQFKTDGPHFASPIFGRRFRLWGLGMENDLLLPKAWHPGHTGGTASQEGRCLCMGDLSRCLLQPRKGRIRKAVRLRKLSSSRSARSLQITNRLISFDSAPASLEQILGLGRRIRYARVCLWARWVLPGPGTVDSGLAASGRANLAVSRCDSQCAPTGSNFVGRRVLGAMALGLVVVSPASSNTNVGRRWVGLFYWHLRLLLVAPLASSG